MGSGVLKAIKRRISSVKNTEQMAKAMQLVASSKLRKIEPKAIAIQPYMKGFTRLIVNHLKRFPYIENKFYQAQSEERDVVLIGIGADKGLCGNFNSLVLKDFHHQVEKFKSEGRNVRLILVGKKLILFARKQSYSIIESFEGCEDKTYKDFSKKIVKKAIAEFNGEEVGEVHLLFTKFYSTVKREVVTVPLLPLKREGFEQLMDIMEHVNLDRDDLGKNPDSPFSEEEERGNVFIYNPAPEVAFAHFARVFIDMIIEMALIESLTSEYSARMIAMKAATDNAKEMLRKLQLYYNRERQSSITMELADITGGAEALKNS